MTSLKTLLLEQLWLPALHSSWERLLMRTKLIPFNQVILYQRFLKNTLVITP